MGFVQSPRTWSNDELKFVMQHLDVDGRVINVSGWKDADKQGGHYRDYFPRAQEYVISNYGADQARGGVDSPSTIALDLGEPAPEALRGTFDVAFSHTVLEHVDDPVFSFTQIAALSRDLVITVVPFKQKLHFEAGQYGDYFRFSPFAMRRMHERAGLTVLYEGFTPRPSLDVYLFYVGTKQPEKHTSFPVKLPKIEALNFMVGEFSAKDLVLNIAERARRKFLGG